MSQVLHIARKDLRHLRWLLLVWTIVLVMRVVLSAIGAASAGDASEGAIIFRELSNLISLLETLMTALVVARLVHAEPLVGWNAFWLTRPYSRGALKTAKLLLGIAALVLMPLAADLTTMSFFHAGPRTQLYAAPQFVSSHLMPALMLSVVAVLTPSLAVFTLSVVGFVVGLAVVFLVMISVALTFGAADAGDSPAIHDPTPGIISTVVFVVAALAVITYQYRHRRWRIAALMAAAGLVLSVMLPGYWPWPFLRPADLDPGRWADSAQATPVIIDTSFGFNDSYAEYSYGFGGSGTPKHQIHGHVELTGMPGHFATRGVTVNGTLTLADGVTLHSRQTGAIVRNRGESLTTTRTPAHAAMGEVTILNAVETRAEEWPVLLSLTDKDHARYQGRTGRFDATLDFHLFRTHILGALPLTPGAALGDASSRVELMRATPTAGGYRLIVRHWYAVSLMSGGSYPTYEFMLRNRREGNAVRLGSEMSWSGSWAGSSLGGQVAGALLGMGVSLVLDNGSGFSVQTEVLAFPRRVGGDVVDSPVKLDRAWLENAELVVLETSYAGTVTRSVSLAGFTIPED